MSLRSITSEKARRKNRNCRTGTRRAAGDNCREEIQGVSRKGGQDNVRESQGEGGATAGAGHVRTIKAQAALLKDHAKRRVHLRKK